MTNYNYNPTGNRKTGAMLTVRSSNDTCPDHCGLKGNGCYAENAPMVWGWERDNKSFNDILQVIKGLPKGAYWRLWEAGDFPHDEEAKEGIDSEHVLRLMSANQGRNGFGYTHYNPFIHDNGILIHSMNMAGLTINLSADNHALADVYFDLGIAPVVTLLKIGSPKVTLTPKGRRIVRCPAEYLEKVTCANCVLCTRADRSYIVGFTAHGSRKKRAASLITTQDLPS